MTDNNSGDRRSMVGTWIAVAVLVVGILTFMSGCVVERLRDLLSAPRPQVERPDGRDERPDDGRDDEPRTERGGDSQGPEEGTLLARCEDDYEVRRLIEDMRAGRLPKECGLLYDQMGANPELVIDDFDTLVEVCECVADIEVLDDIPAMSVTDSYHHVRFVLQDGTEVGWSFEGAGVVVTGGDLVSVAGDEQLWRLAQAMYRAGDDWQPEELPKGAYRVVVNDKERVVCSAPVHATTGQEVTLEMLAVEDTYPAVKVECDGKDVEVKQQGLYWSFEMPDEDVTVTVTLEDYGLGGS